MDKSTGGGGVVHGKASSPAVAPPAGCARHREEMTLLALQKKLADKSIPAAELARVSAEVARLERELGL